MLGHIVYGTGRFWLLLHDWNFVNLDQSALVFDVWRLIVTATLDPLLKTWGCIVKAQPIVIHSLRQQRLAWNSAYHRTVTHLWLLRRVKNVLVLSRALGCSRSNQSYVGVVGTCWIVFAAFVIWTLVLGAISTTVAQIFLGKGIFEAKLFVWRGSMLALTSLWNRGLWLRLVGAGLGCCSLITQIKLFEGFILYN